MSDEIVLSYVVRRVVRRFVHLLRKHGGVLFLMAMLDNDAPVGAALSHCSTAWRVLPIAETCSMVSIVSCIVADSGILPFFGLLVYSVSLTLEKPPFTLDGEQVMLLLFGFWMLHILVLDAAYDD